MGTLRHKAAFGIKRSLTLTNEVFHVTHGLAYRYYGEEVRFPARAISHVRRLDLEPEKQEFLRVHCTAGSTVLDLGAHIGLFTVLMSRYVGNSGTVVAFEPTPHTAAMLRSTVAMNRCANVTVRAEAISAEPAVRLLYDAGRTRSRRNALVDVPESRRTHEVRTVRIDDLGLTNVSCIKMDIEGSELHALEGARHLLTAQRPAMALEVHPVQLQEVGRSMDELWDFLCDLDYVVSLHGLSMSRTEFLAPRDCYEVTVLPA